MTTTTDDGANSGERHAITAGEEAWERLVDAVAAGDVPVLDALRKVHTEVVPEGDCERFVIYMRVIHMLMRDKRIFLNLAAEVNTKVRERDYGQDTVSDFRTRPRRRDSALINSTSPARKYERSASSLRFRAEYVRQRMCFGLSGNGGSMP